MKGYKVSNPNELSLVDMPSDLDQGQVKIRMNRVGLSREDVAQFRSQTPNNFVLSRQGVGMIVETAPDVEQFVRGNRVLISPYTPCLNCVECRQHGFGLCHQLQVAGKNTDGYLRDFVIAYERNLFLLPDNVSDNEAVFVEHIARALAIIAKLDMKKGEHIVIVGASIVGLILSQLAIHHQVIPILIDGRQSHLDMAGKLGIYYAINYVDSDPYKKLMSITGGRMGENVVLIGAGGISLSNSLRLVCPGGSVTIADVDNYTDNDSSAVPIIAQKQLSVYGIGMGNGLKYFMPSINLLANKTVTVSPFVSREIAFDQVLQTIQHMSSNPYEYIKVVVK